MTSETTRQRTFRSLKKGGAVKIPEVEIKTEEKKPPVFRKLKGQPQNAQKKTKPGQTQIDLKAQMEKKREARQKAITATTDNDLSDNVTTKDIAINTDTHLENTTQKQNITTTPEETIANEQNPESTHTTDHNPQEHKNPTETENEIPSYTKPTEPNKPQNRFAALKDAGKEKTKPITTEDVETQGISQTARLLKEAQKNLPGFAQDLLSGEFNETGIGDCGRIYNSLQREPETMLHDAWQEILQTAKILWENQQEDISILFLENCATSFHPPSSMVERVLSTIKKAKDQRNTNRAQEAFEKGNVEEALKLVGEIEDRDISERYKREIEEQDRQRRKSRAMAFIAAGVAGLVLIFMAIIGFVTAVKTTREPPQIEIPDFGTTVNTFENMFRQNRTQTPPTQEPTPLPPVVTPPQTTPPLITPPQEPTPSTPDDSQTPNSQDTRADVLRFDAPQCALFQVVLDEIREQMEQGKTLTSTETANLSRFERTLAVACQNIQPSPQDYVNASREAFRDESRLEDVINMILSGN